MVESDGAEHCIVKVADIMEYPTELGNKCSLLREFGLNAYWNTEEQLFEAITESATQPNSLEFCLKSSRCRKFYEIYGEGRTPFSERDPIRLLEYGGRYWASEGKHRVCMAKRAGVESLEALVYHLAEDTETILPHEGEHGHFHFSYSFLLGTRKQEEVRGTAGYLWVTIPPGFHHSRFGFRGGWLNVSLDTEGELRELFSGLQYSVSVKKELERVSFFRRMERFTVESEVIISPNHPKVKIWLLEIPAKELPGFCYKGTLSLHTLYRAGCWRMSHLKQLSGNCLSMY